MARFAIFALLLLAWPWAAKGADDFAWPANATAAISLTFDDGQEDNHLVAKPVLDRLGVKASFFVPTDSAGAEARLEGVVKLKKVTADHVQHMEQEGATFADKHPDGSASEVALVATGVELKK